MMLYPAMGELSSHIHNRYMLVNVVSRRARQIAEAYENAHQILEEKPVTIAINEVANGILDPEKILFPETEADSTPESAETVETPAGTDTVDTPDTPNAVDTPEAPDTPNAVDTPEAPDTPDAVDTPEVTETADAEKSA